MKSQHARQYDIDIAHPHLTSGMKLFYVEFFVRTEADAIESKNAICGQRDSKLEKRQQQRPTIGLLALGLLSMLRPPSTCSEQNKPSSK